ncbi:MAG: hypothetical protein ACOY3Z_09200 [Thermodesulfobacteriota bacterium]
MNILAEQKLENGAFLLVEDRSRKIAGDRWLSKVSCRAIIPLAEACDSLPADLDDPALRAEVLARLGQEIVFSLDKERNFVDEKEHPEVLRKMVEDVFANMRAYLATPSFPEKLLRKRYEEARQACLIERQYASLPQSGDEDDGPADFSSCFRD